MGGKGMLIPLLVGISAFVVGCGLGAALVWRSHAEVRDAAEQLRVQFAQSQASLQAEKEKTTWTEEVWLQLRDTFKALASDELEAKSQQLKTTAKEELGGLVTPLKEELG